MFDGDFAEGKEHKGKHRCTVEDTSMAAFRHVLRYLYVDEMDIPFEDAIEVLRLAGRYGIDRLFNHTMRLTSVNIKNSTVVRWFIESHKHGLENLRGTTKCFLVRNFRRIRDSHRDTMAELGSYPSLLLEIMMEAI